MKPIIWIIIAVVALVILACVGVVALGVGGFIAFPDEPTTIARGGQGVVERVKPPRQTDSKAEPAPAQVIGSVGETLVYDPVQLTINQVEMDWESTADLSSDPAEGNQYVVFDVTITNVGDEDFPYNSFFFTLKDSEGFEYDRGFVIGGPGQELSSGRLDPGDKIRGWMIFEVPIEVEGLKAIYVPLIAFRDDIKITVLLQP